MAVGMLVNFLVGLTFGYLILALLGIPANIGLVIGATIGSAIYGLTYKEPQS